MPQRLAEWLRYDAPANYDVVELYRALKTGMTAEALLDRLKGDARVMTARMWGHMHPSLPTAQHEFACGRNPYAQNDNQVACAA